MLLSTRLSGLSHPASPLGTFYVILLKPLGCRRGFQCASDANWGMRRWVASLRSLEVTEPGFEARPAG